MAGRYSIRQRYRLTYEVESRRGDLCETLAWGQLPLDKDISLYAENIPNLLASGSRVSIGIYRGLPLKKNFTSIRSVVESSQRSENLKIFAEKVKSGFDGLSMQPTVTTYTKTN